MTSLTTIPIGTEYVHANGFPSMSRRKLVYVGGGNYIVISPNNGIATGRELVQIGGRGRSLTPPEFLRVSGLRSLDQAYLHMLPTYH